jgi:hypothetical protein
LIGGLLDERVLECVGGPRRAAVLVEQFRLDQLPEALLQRAFVQRRHRLEQVIGKRPPDGGTQLRQRFDRRQAIEPRREGIPQRGGNRQRGQRAGQLIAGFALLQQARFQHHLSQPVPRLRPAGAQQRHFRLPPHQRREPARGHHV